MSTTARPGFRPEIQALRALAVTLVVVFHLWPDALPGGYVGVDVFFVISGFLITGGLWSEVQRTGRIGLAGFWARRIRRLLPAASAVLVGSLVLALLFVPKSLWQPTVVQIGASALYVQNWVLAAGSVDYLAAEGTPTLVQHLWSLSVEEQFYLVWPLVMLLAVVVSRRRTVVLAAFGMLALASFVYSLSLTGVPSGYFDTAGRAWEFAAGGLLAFAPALRGRLAPLASLVGLALIGASAVLYSGSTVFPGAAALLPVVGAVLVIAGGTSRVVARVSGLAPVRFVGDQSYALYLWHWPLIVCLPYVVGEAGDGWTVGVLAVTVLLAWLTTRFVEEPLRRMPVVGVRRPYLIAVVGVVVIVTASTVTWSGVQTGIAASAQTSGDRFSSDPCFGAEAMVNDCSRPFAVTDAVDTAFAAQDKGALAQRCNSYGITVSTCEFGDLDDPERTIALVGNSHAAHLVAGLEAYAQQNHWRVVLMRKTDCLGVSTLDAGGTGGQACRDWTAAVLERLESDPTIDVVLFASHANALHYLAAAQPSKETIAALQDDIASNLSAVRASGPAVIVVGDVPGTRPVPAPECVYLHRADYDPCATGRSSDALEDGNVEMAAAASTPGIRTLSLLPYVCGAALCHSVIGGVLVYFDDHHLTASFSRSLAPYLGAAVEAALG